MLTSLRLVIAFVLVISVCGLAWAQTVSDAPSSTSVTAAATEQGMRFTATADVVEMRLEIFSATGQKLFDTKFRRGNVFDWRTQDDAGLSLEPHLWVVTVKTLAGQLRQRHGSVSWQSGRVQVQRVSREQLTIPQTQALDFSRAAQALPPLAMDADTTSFNLLSEQTPAAIITAHDSQSGQVTSTAGALTFRTGNLFAGKDVERMRITEDGKVGIGTDQPKATLDIVGAVRVSEGIKFADGATLNSTDGKLTMRDANGESIPTANATGTGTQNQVAKWTETGGAGTLGDSAITEVNGNVGIGLTNPAARLHVFGSTETVIQTLSNTNSYIQFGFYEGAVKKGAFGYQGSTSTGFMGGPAAMAFGTLTGSPVAFFTNSTERVRLDSNGNFGIGTTTPMAKLHVVGTINVTGFRTEADFSSFPNVIGGHSGNTVGFALSGATIGGGFANSVTENNGTVGGGSRNTAGRFSTVGGGDSNNASGDFSAVGGGDDNTASGIYSIVPGGKDNIAQGDDSFAAGLRAQALHRGSFVWSDSTTGFGNFFASTANDQFLINATGGVGIGTNAPGYRLDVVGRSRIRQNAGQTGGTDSAGLWLFQNTPAADSAFVGMETDNSVGFYGGNGGGWGMIMNTQTGDVGIGTTGPTQKLHVQGNGLFTGNLTVNGNVGIGTSAPDAKLSVNGQASKPGGGSWNVFSDERLKNIKGRFASGLNAVMKLQPLRYEYKNGNALDLKSEGEYIGFSAQAVQKVIPEAVTKNAQGYLLVNNDPIMWTMLNAIKEQQGQIQQQQEQLKKQQSLIEGLTKLVCRDNPNAEVCK